MVAPPIRPGARKPTPNRTERRHQEITPAALRPAEAAVYLSISRVTLYRLVAAGGLPPPIKVGSISLWARADLDEWIQRKRGEVVP